MHFTNKVLLRKNVWQRPMLLFPRTPFNHPYYVINFYLSIFLRYFFNFKQSMRKLAGRTLLEALPPNLLLYLESKLGNLANVPGKMNLPTSKPTPIPGI